ncbi:MAG: flagellar protein FliT [Pseudomonadales bacterium]|nr:flagellar protein FliT [Pseudomonadales bacterium]
MNTFDSTVEGINGLSVQMKEAALSGEWDTFAAFEQQRQSMLRLLRYDNYRDLVSVDRFAESIEAILESNKELLVIVEGGRDIAAAHLEQFRKNKQASSAYSQP